MGAPGAPDAFGPGVTPGGVQDIEYARQLVSEGVVPPADAITVEGLLSQHDLPTMGPPCTDLLCLRPAVAVAPSLETGETAYVAGARARAPPMTSWATAAWMLPCGDIQRNGRLQST